MICLNLKKLNKKSKYFFILTFLYFLRLLFLESDPKFAWLSQQWVVDEIAYHETAIKTVNEGISALLSGNLVTTSLANTKTFLLPNLLAAASMSVFGNNFWGLRFTYVMLGYVIGILLRKCLVIVIPNHEKIQLLTLLAYILDFHFFLQTRSAMTIVPCTFAAILLLFFLLNYTGKTRWFLTGCLSVISFCIIYMGVPFLVLWAGFIWLTEMIFDKENRKGGSFYFLGILAGTAISEFMNLLIYRQHIWDTIIDTLSAHGGKIQTSEFSLKLFLNHFKSFLCSYQFIYNYLLLVMSIIAIGLLIYGIFAQKDKTAFLICSLICVHWLQTVFLDQLTESKASITFAVLLVGIAYAFTKYYETFMQEGWLHNIFLIGSTIVIIGSMVLIYCNYREGRALSSDLRHLLYICSIFTAFCLFLILITNRKKIFYLAFSISMIFCVTASSYYTLFHRSYAESEMMKDIGERTQDGIVINGLCFSLYNKCQYPVNIYDHYRGRGYDFDYVRETIQQSVYEYDELYCVFSLTIGDEWNVPTINDTLLADTPYQFELVKEYQIDYTEYPDEESVGLYNIGLYKKAERTD